MYSMILVLSNLLLLLGLEIAESFVDISVSSFQDIRHLMTFQDRRNCFQEFKDVNYTLNSDIGLSIVSF